MVRAARVLAVAALLGSGAGAPLPGQEARPALSYERDIRPLFVEHCLPCHGGIKRESGLSLRSRRDATRPAESGRAAIVPGQPDASEILRRVTSPDRDERMPPKGARLSKGEVEKLRAWIAGGAAWKDHWAFVPVEAAAAPGSVDRFILAGLERHGLRLSPEADRPALLRRVAFDLTGLPPSPDEVRAFVTDPSPDAYEKVVERLLASPAYGERWGKLWLDAAGYADSNGYWDADTDRPHAWRYRDWVIDAINRDLPFDEFVRLQLAGDELAGYRPGGDVTPEIAPRLVATHFLRNAPDGSGESDGNPDERQRDRFRTIEAQLQNAMGALLGLPVQCAKCHDHPFEPVTQAEYYQLQAILTAAYTPDPKRWQNPKAREVVAATRDEIAAYEKAAEPGRREIKSFEESIKTAARIAGFGDEDRAALREILSTPQEERTAGQKAFLSSLKVPAKVDPDELAKSDPEFAAEQKVVKARIEQIRKALPQELPRIAALFETHAEPLPHRLKKRGVYTDPAGEAAPGVPAALTGPGYEYTIEKPQGLASSGNRTAFARWITSPRNPLFARTIVNRVWQGHFGTGLVATSDNLGESGERPSHPELLDFLAGEFVRDWSLKSLHRKILLSATYRQSSAFNAAGFRADPEGRLLWRHPLRRLDAESVRDAMLAVAGTLDPRRGGPFVPVTGKSGAFTIDEKTPGALRRSVYLQHRRSQMPTFLTVLDAPSMEINCALRTCSTAPLQSLVFLNSEFAVARAREFAARLRREEPGDDAKRLERAFVAAIGRPPEGSIRAHAEAFLAAQKKLYGSDPGRAWSDLCQMILASNAFLYVE